VLCLALEVVQNADQQLQTQCQTEACADFKRFMKVFLCFS
jgi:hypothetical protein